MTLAEVLPIAQQLSAIEKLHLIRILVDELDSTDSAPNLVVSGATYPIWTPLDQYGAARDMLDAFPDMFVPGPEAAATA